MVPVAFAGSGARLIRTLARIWEAHTVEMQGAPDRRAWVERPGDRVP